MMRGEMALGAYRTRHDHPIEEFYLALSGQVMMQIEDQEFKLSAGDFVWTGVGTSHAFRQIGDEPFFCGLKPNPHSFLLDLEQETMQSVIKGFRKKRVNGPCCFVSHREL